MLDNLEQKANYKIFCLKNSVNLIAKLLRFKRLAFSIFSIILSFFMMGTLVSCHEKTKEQAQEEADALLRSLIAELKNINTYQELKQQKRVLSTLFLRLVDLIIQANQAQPSEAGSFVYSKDHEISDKLRSELIRIYHIDGGQEIIEQAQEQALRKLAFFESKMTKKG